MGRKKRIWIPQAFYHIVCRGNPRDTLFRDATDFVCFMQILEKVNEKIPYQLVSYCLMTNHFYLQLRPTEEPISKIMSLINKRYADYYNTKYRLTGHVFEKRYFSDHIDDAAGMLEVSRYIHLNPVKAGMVIHAVQYKWSSFPFYYTKTTTAPRFIDSYHLLTYFPGDKEERRRQYVKYCLNLKEDNKML